ncbi:LysR substrate-binding domain-containing protein [Lysinibacillus sphaericus]|uniref:LysR substrate-binding domain-containing protein n=1 Tax=Lysinibacillus sphaericus TaxID=1421 RepID=UPI001E2CACA6|nr:LysR substrate-binding domain-containing protein [Lysinibacillus sphaericus]
MRIINGISLFPRNKYALHLINQPMLLLLLHVSLRYIENLIAGHIGSLRLGASGLPAYIFMPDLIHQVSLAYPEIRISLEVKTAPEIENKGALQEIDFGLIMETKQENTALQYETIGEDSLVLAFSPTHELASKRASPKRMFLKISFYCILLLAPRITLSKSGWTLFSLLLIPSNWIL